MTRPATKSGIVYLVGAGPGDPRLITVRGADLLELADVVVYDFLANPRLLSYCPQAETIYVGKKAASHSLPQDQINQLLIDKAKDGKRVVRLKGGDPFVFGRGGEECQALAAAGVKFEVVPGITASIAAPAYAGIPVTHRDFNSTFTLVTGHEKEEDGEGPVPDKAPAATDIDYSVLAKLPCLAFYMGVKSLPRICQSLMNAGKPGTTPAAVIQWGTTPRQRTAVGTLADLPEKVAEAKIGPPALILIGGVVALRQELQWFERRALFGQSIVVTRTRQQASDLTSRLEELGAEVIEAATIELVEPDDFVEIDAALNSAGSFDWVIFTSVNGVAATKKRLMELGRDARALGQAKIAAIGTATAEAIERQLCLRVDLCPESFVAEALAEALAAAGSVNDKRCLLLRADIARPVLRERLMAGGAAEVRDVAIYQSRTASALPAGLTQRLADGSVHWITFTSSSTARNFVALLGGDYRRLLGGVKLASIGPVTTATLVELGLKATVEARQYNIEGLVQAMIDLGAGGPT